MDYLGLAALVVALTGFLAGFGGFLKIVFELKGLHKIVNSLSDKRAKEAHDGGIDRGGMEERERSDARELANPTQLVPKLPIPNDPTTHLN